MPILRLVAYVFITEPPMRNVKSIHARRWHPLDRGASEFPSSFFVPRASRFTFSSAVARIESFMAASSTLRLTSSGGEVIFIALERA